MADAASDHQAYEKLGAFYLGRVVGDAGAVTAQPLLYDSRDLVTHGVCIGMTGSGKTGLCLAAIEEAAIDGVPVLAIDPKGDLPNLLLAFPELRGKDFAAWADPDAARRAGLDLAAFGAREAERWRAGLAEWDQDPARIRRLREAAEFAVYTPGSTAGIPLSVLASFAAPPPAVRGDDELLAERATAVAAALLALVGVDADPLAGREPILLALILSAAWREGRDLDLAALIGLLQRPPLARVGVVELEAFMPAGERFALAMRLNNLLASPSFAAWSRGEPIDLDRLLRAPDGRPRVAIVSIAHLGERERMFVVALLLQQVLAWTRAQAGTTSLRALLYVDEIAGYLPPVAAPPSKAPLLTLLKQARAFGVGCLLATQNPVDLDYKALANCGTWFIGRLQTERDRMRVLDALAAAGDVDRAVLERQIAGLAPRRFVLHDVHADRPVVFASRWALCWLRGPMTREEIRRLMAGRGGAVAATAPAAAVATAPTLPPAIAQRWLPVRTPRPAEAVLRYRPRLAVFASIAWRDGGARVDVPVALLADPAGGAAWTAAGPIALRPEDVAAAPAADAAAWDPVPSAAIADWRRIVAAADDVVRRDSGLARWASPSLGLRSRPGEDETAFRSRAAQAGRERRDAAVEALRRGYAARLAAAEERVRRLEAARDREADQAGQAKLQGWIAIGSGVLGALLGRRGCRRRTSAAPPAPRAAPDAPGSRGRTSPGPRPSSPACATSSTTCAAAPRATSPRSPTSIPRGSTSRARRCGRPAAMSRCAWSPWRGSRCGRRRSARRGWRRERRGRPCRRTHGPRPPAQCSPPCP